jgi:hypothetical protein
MDRASAWTPVRGSRPSKVSSTIEVTLGAATNDRDVRHLHWLSDRQGGGALLDAVVITTSAEAWRRRGGMAAVHWPY